MSVGAAPDCKSEMVSTEHGGTDSEIESLRHCQFGCDFDVTPHGFDGLPVNLECMVLLKAVPKPFRPLPTQIILSVAEHHANLVPWQMLAKRTGAVLRHAELTPTQEVDVEVGFASPPPTPAVSSAASAKEAAWQCLMTYL